MYFEQLVEELKKLDEVEALALGGSRSTPNYDEKSDYDLYVYVSKMPSLNIRKQILNKFCSYIELNNSYWELEDDCTLKDGIDIDIIYRNIDEISEKISAVLDYFNAQNGYTTCMWYNLINSKILYDKNNKLTALQKKYDIPYPQELKDNIIKKNFSLLTNYLPSYDKQIYKALARHDYVSVNNRLAAFLDSYFDIIYALNEIKHPGEKRLMSIALKQCDILPNNFEENINKLFANVFKNDDAFVQTLKDIILELKKII